ncbi:NAD-dependent succinate-semialdehyde dehydrogenase [Promicromonospora soli]|uniref:NAD-dependent succinate-semialdehyde dehydrogenase n=1 Tax=Promicromonospora soli TaxID=2035533 RepID=A0A919FH90_9MICO|nr:NAD-dependent succinate-semialdehyde dehydrogenase [Promicromonospora soli]GHH65574.1 NAD-dependent succinate-semialdehyde dehydrogenase [Promicromonospora soli]
MTRTEVAPARVDVTDVLAGVPRDLFLGGRWVPAANKDRMPVVNPATEEVLTEVADAGARDALAALEAAERAQESWARTSARTRSEILYRAFELTVERTEQLALLMTLEMGKPLADARGEVAYAAEFFRWFAEEAVRIDGGYSHRPDGAARNLQVRQPVGPSLLIIPWNFPLAMGARKLGPAIAAGCVSILKPAPQTPLCSLALAEILAEAGLPDGVLSVVTTSRAADVVTPMLESGVIRKLSFTGSTEVGKLLLAQASRNVLRTSMELGGNAPFLVLEDADLDRAVDAAFQAKMRNMGEACTAANRFFVHATVAEQFAGRLAERMGALTVGDGTRDGVDVGPLIDEPSREKVRVLIDDAVDRGASVLVGGGRPDGPGYFVEPTVLTGTDPRSALTSTEIFGPVAAIQTFTSLDDAIRRANDTEWGLVGYVATQDLDNALNVAERLEVGMVGINSGVVSTPSAPFGGVKQSGLGREGGRIGIDEFLETKYISIPVRP